MRAALLALVIACGGDSYHPPIQADVGTGRFDELAAARTQVVAAIEEQPDAPGGMAQLALVDGLNALLYGVPAEEHVFAPVAPNAPGYRAWVIGKVAFELTRVTKAEQLTELGAHLDELGKTAPDDLWRRWLVARVALVRGDRVAAAEQLDQIQHPLAAADYAMLLADDGKLDEARRILEAVDLGDSHDVTTMMLGLISAELDNPTTALSRFDRVPTTPRMTAYKLLGDAELAIRSERYELVADALTKLGRMRALPNECPLWERIAWLHLQLGRSVGKLNDHKIASIARTHCAALGKATGENPRLALVDAHLQLGLGKPEHAKRIAERIPLLWGRVIAAHAAFDLGTPGLVPALFDSLPNDERYRYKNDARRAAFILERQAKAILLKGEDQAAALELLADRSDKDARARHALGSAYFTLGKLDAATRELRRVVSETSATRPDPFAYRTHQLLAEIAIATHDLTTASAEIDRAIEIHPGNVQSRVIQARIQLRRGEPDRTLETLAQLRKTNELTPAAKLLVAEALMTRRDPTIDQRAQAKTLILEVIGKLPPPDVGRVAGLIDPRLPAELKLPVGKLPKQGM